MPKNGFREIEKINVRIRISILDILLCVHFQAKQITLTFLTQIWQKIDLGLENQKTTVDKNHPQVFTNYVHGYYVLENACTVLTENKIGKYLSPVNADHYALRKKGQPLPQRSQ